MTTSFVDENKSKYLEEDAEPSSSKYAKPYLMYVYN